MGLEQVQKGNGNRMRENRILAIDRLTRNDMGLFIAASKFYA